MAGEVITLSTSFRHSPEEMESLVRRDINFFSHESPEDRLAAIEEIFTPDIIWFDFDGTTHRGHDGLLERSSLLIGQLHGYSHRAADKISVCQNMATARWEVVPVGTESDHDQVPVIQGGDVLVVENNMIKVLWSYVDTMDAALLPYVGKAAR